MNYKIISLEDRYDLFERQYKISEEAWPEFMFYDSVATTYWMQFIEAFREYQLSIMDGEELLAVINAAPMHFEKSLKELPDGGWDWGVEKSLADYNAGIKPNILLGLQIVVNINHQGKGLSSLSVREMSRLAAEKGFNKLIIPVRPSDKHKYPLIPMENYIEWKNAKSLPFDNWLRVHIKAGGEIIKTCSKSMYIPGTIDEWKKWTNLEFPGSGSYIIPGALNPISIDISNNKGTYIEPNVWILHNIKKDSTV